MKRALLAILQFFLFLVTYAVATFAVPIHRQSIIGHSARSTRLFIWDGLILAGALFTLILLAEILRKRARSAAPWTAIAFVLALVVSFALKLGFVTREF